MTSFQSEQAGIIPKQNSGQMAKYAIYHLIFAEKTQNLYTHMREAED